MTVEYALRIAESTRPGDVSVALAAEVRRLQRRLEDQSIDIAESAATLNEVQGDYDRAMKSERVRFAELHATQDERDALASDLVVARDEVERVTQELMKEYKTRCLVQKEFDRVAIMLPGDLPVISAQRDTLKAERDALQIQLHDMGTIISKVMSSATYTMLRHLYHPEEQV